MIDGEYGSGIGNPKFGFFGLERFSVDQGTITVDFSKQECLTDPDIADACVEVLTSDGHIGTISHLTISHNPKLFAADLQRKVGSKQVPAILAGGLEDVPKSVELVGKLFTSLRKAGFVVAKTNLHSDVLGRYHRQATLFSDKVVVMRRPYGDNTVLYPLELKFPNPSSVMPLPFGREGER